MEEKYYTCKNDRAFKEIFLKEKNKYLLKRLLESILKVSIEEIEVKPNERNTKNLKVRRKTYDALLKTNQGKIEIEVNANAKKDYVKPRNMSYLCDLYSHHTLKGDEYNEDTKIIQINFSYGLGKKKKNIRKYYIMDEEKVMFISNFEIIEINMDYFLNLWYSKDKKKVKENEYLIMLGLEKEELKKFSQESEDVRNYMEELNKINEDPEFREYMSYEEDQMKIHNSEMREAREKGLKQGIEHGQEIEKKQMIQSFAKQKIPVEIIAKAANISEDEVVKIINNN